MVDIVLSCSCFVPLNIKKLERPNIENYSKAELKTLVYTLFDVIDELIEKVNVLTQRVAELEAKKTSSNSSIPPSQDYGRVQKNQSLRQKSKRSKGGQKGHKGSTLQMTSTPDVVLKHSPNFCTKCGNDLSAILAQLQQTRQVIDIPIARTVTTEHQSFLKTCSCGHENKGDFPVNVNGNVQYGQGVESMAAYFSVRQFMPFQRMKECFSDLFNLPLSTGTLVNLISRMALKATPAYHQIKENILASPVLGSDETGAKVGGDNGWFWVWQNKLNTFIVSDQSRGYQVIAKHFPDGLKNAILETDCLPAQLKTQTKGNQLCLAHLLRELNYFEELYENDWSKKLKQVFIKAINFKKQIEDYIIDNPIRDNLQKQLTQLLESDFEQHPKLLKTFHKRLLKNRDSIFPFLYHAEVHSDNNASERAIRNIKVKQKVSGQFNNQVTASQFAVLRSIIDTSIKNKTNIFENLTLVAKLTC